MSSGAGSVSGQVSRSPGASSDATVIEGQKKALELAVHGAPLADVLAAVARTVEEQSAAEVMASILLLDDAGKHLLHGAAPSLPAAYNAAIDGIAIGPAVGSCGTAAFTSRTVVVRDIQTDPLWASFKELAGQHGLRACWSTPILAPDRSVLGTFALYHRIPTEPTERDRVIVDLLANTAALVIERDRRERERERGIRASLEAQSAQLAALFEHAPAAIAVLGGPDHVFEMANPTYVELIGGRQVAGKAVAEALPEIAGQGFVEILDTVRRTGEPYIGRAQPVALQRRAGEPLDQAYCDFVYQPVPGADGAVQTILVVAFEVTGLVRAKEEAEAARRRAEESEAALRTFVDNLPELAWTARPDGHIDYYNRRWYAYTGTTYEEMQGWGWERVHDPALLPVVAERWKRSLATGEPFEMEFTLRGADGIPRWFLTRVSASRDADGKVLRWFGTNTNIDDMKATQALTAAMAEQSLEAQQALLTMRDELERAQRRVAELERGGRDGPAA